jgi:hypothetical protein
MRPEENPPLQAWVVKLAEGLWEKPGTLNRDETYTFGGSRRQEGKAFESLPQRLFKC